MINNFYFLLRFFAHLWTKQHYGLVMPVRLSGCSFSSTIGINQHLEVWFPGTWRPYSFHFNSKYPPPHQVANTTALLLQYFMFGSAFTFSTFYLPTYFLLVKTSCEIQTVIGISKGNSCRPNFIMEIVCLAAENYIINIFNPAFRVRSPIAGCKTTWPESKLFQVLFARFRFSEVIFQVSVILLPN